MNVIDIQHQHRVRQYIKWQFF